MKRFGLLAICALLVGAILGFWESERLKYRRIALTLLEMHHQWAANDYHAKGMTLPRFLAEQGHVSAYGAGILGADVEYDYQKGGLEWRRRYHIWRTDTNTTTWVLYESAGPKNTNLVRMAWKHKLITVTGEP